MSTALHNETVSALPELHDSPYCSQALRSADYREAIPHYAELAAECSRLGNDKDGRILIDSLIHAGADMFQWADICDGLDLLTELFGLVDATGQPSTTEYEGETVDSVSLNVPSALLGKIRAFRKSQSY